MKELKTLKDIVELYTFHYEEIRRSIKQEAIKWVKEDWRYVKEVENINPFKIIMDWMKRLNITEEDLK